MTHPPFTFTPQEIEVLRAKPGLAALPTRDWAARHFRIADGSHRGRVFDHSMVPYAAGIMDVWDKPWTRKIVWAAPSQSAKTSVAYACLCSHLWRDPAGAGILMPDEQAAKRIFEKRFLRHFELSGELKQMLDHTDRHAAQSREVRLSMGVMVYALWAGSESRISSVTLRYLLGDEIDANEDRTATGIAEERLIAHPHDSKCFLFSKIRGTDKQSTIWPEMKSCQAQYEYEARCPACNTYQRMDQERIRVPEGERDPVRIRAEKLAWYECSRCGYRWNDHVRNVAVARGRWVTDCLLEKPATAGFHLPSWYSRFISLSRVMADFFKARATGDPAEMRAWDNAHPCKPYQVRRIVTPAEQVKKMVLPDLVPLTVPDRALALTCGIDSQMQGFWFVVRAWARSGESWLVQYGWLNTWDEVHKLVFETSYPVAGTGARMPVWRAAIDIGGGVVDEQTGWSKTDDVKTWLQEQPVGKIYGIKGASRTMAESLRPTDIAGTPGVARKNQSQRLTIYLIDTARFKESIHLARLRPDSAQPMWLHSSPGDDYVRQMTAERKEVDAKTGKEKWLAGSRANHLFDCEVYAAACADPVWTPSLRLLPEPVYVAQPRQPRTSSGYSHPAARMSGRVVNPFAR